MPITPAIQAAITRVKHTTQGVLLGGFIALSLCAAAYIHTHEIRFTATASNEAPEMLRAESNSISMASLLPGDDKPASARKIKTFGDFSRSDIVAHAVAVPSHKPLIR